MCLMHLASVSYVGVWRLLDWEDNFQTYNPVRCKHLLSTEAKRLIDAMDKVYTAISAHIGLGNVHLVLTENAFP